MLKTILAVTSTTALLLSSRGLSTSGQAPVGQNIAISVDDPRPLASAIQALQDRSGWIITYEEGPWLYSKDAVDVTESVRKDGDFTRRVLVPRGGPFTFAGTVGSETESREQLLQALLEAYRVAGYPGEFRIVRTGAIFHVVIARNKNSKGEMETRRSLLDVPVTIPSAERNAFELVDAVLKGVTRATGATLHLGSFPMNLFARIQISGGAVDESARAVLVRIVEATDNQVSWRLFCSPGSAASCTLNLGVVRR